MSLTGLILVIFLICILVGIIIWAFPQTTFPAPIKNALLVALIVICVVLLVVLAVGGGSLRLAGIG